jgi:NADH:ubiquinone oxidoreductase subunit F (NADH-binding)
VSIAGIETTLPRVLAGLGEHPMAQLGHHLDAHGGLPSAAELDGRALLAAIEAAGLRGRGGARFPTAAKIRSVRAARGRAIVLANGCESEPMSRKDALLLSELPHLVLDGAALAARAAGADAIVLAVEGGRRSPSRIAVEHALAQRRAAGIDPVEVTVFAAAEAFLTGQETSLVAQVNGGPARPTFVPPRPASRGVRRRPTLVCNVETLAHVALIARHGPDWYRSLGTDDDPGSTLVTLAGAVAAPGVYEIEWGTPLERLIAAAGADGPISGLLVGGYFGSWLAPDAAGALELSSAGLKAHGATLGCGVVVALPERCCPVAETVAVTTYLAAETANQCGPCVHGSAAIARTLAGIASGRSAPGALKDIARWSTAIAGRGACHLPDGLAQFVSTALAVFAPAFQDHARNGACEACRAQPVLHIPHRRSSA